MTGPTDPTPEALSGDQLALERYLDGDMPAQEREGFESVLASRPELRRQVELQQKIDLRLRALFTPDIVAPDLQLPLSVPRRSHRRLITLAAAALVLLAVVVFQWWSSGSQGNGALTPAAVYARELKSGFVPKEVCTDDPAFKAWVSRRYGQGLSMPEPPAGLTLVGWDYADVISPYSGVLLAKFEGREVLVIIDRAGLEHEAFATGKHHGLYVHRDIIGSLVAYEVSPLPEAKILPALHGTPCEHKHAK